MRRLLAVHMVLFAIFMSSCSLSSHTTTPKTVTLPSLPNVRGSSAHPVFLPRALTPNVPALPGAARQTKRIKRDIV